MLKRLLTLLALVVFAVPATFAQGTGTVTGKVTDAQTGETLPGVNVQLVELQRGAATNTKGVYRLGGIEPGDYTLRASFVGYQAFETQVTVRAGETTTVNVQLESGAVGLDEVVVTGYASQRGTEVSGSISNVSANEIQGLPSQNPQSLLQGRAAGVQLTSTSGNPGGGFNINIRGQGSISAGNDPLFIVDGVQIGNLGSEVNDRSPLNAIDPSNIKSIEVLKDAAAAAIYGAQAANGVVLITTKSGRQGETRVNVTFEGGVRSEIANFNTLSQKEWIDFNVDALGERGFRQGLLPIYGYDPAVPFDQLRNTNWEDFITRQGLHRKVGFSANGGNETTQFYLAGNWTNTEAAVREVSYENYNFRTNITQQFTQDLQVDAKVNLSAGDEPGVCQDGFFINCPWSGIQFEPPVTYPYLDNGEYNPNTTFGKNNNMAVVLNEESRQVNTTQIIGNISPTYDITQNLSLQGTAGIDWQRIYEVDYESPIADPGDGGSRSDRSATLTNMTLNARLNYNNTFADVHSIDALVGTEYRREFEIDNEFGVRGFNNSLLRVPAAASSIQFFQGFNTEFRLLSGFGTVNYNYDSRYLFTLTGRYDGTSRFGENRRFGFFPSVSAAWRISQEDFADFDFLNELKLRASYGVTGNSDIGNFPARGLYDVQGSYKGQVGLDPDQLQNPALTWEENQEINLGLDWAFFDNRITGSLDVYRSNTDELLLGRPLPSSSGFGGITENVGSVRNQGIELQLRTVNIQTESFEWSTRFNAGLNQNTVQSLSQGQEELNSGASIPVATGHSQFAWKVPRWAGVNPADGRPMWYDANGNITYQPDVGDSKFFDGAEKDVEGGFGTNLSYQGLSLDVFFQFAYGAMSRPQTLRFFLFEQGAFSAGHKILTQRWKEPGDVTEVPRAVPFGNYRAADDFDANSTYFLFDSSYLRMKNVRLSYDLPSELANYVRLRSARIYVSGTNLLTWTSYLGLDPEVPGPNSNTSYPNERQINVGIQLGL
ncbi:MAG: SusC/RagA family TonB-linked outer membrane protein [Salinibacter sp.]